MRLDKEIQENSYFKYRNADVPSNEKIIPHWIRSEIESKELKILDYGCGYGDILCDPSPIIFSYEIKCKASN